MRNQPQKLLEVWDILCEEWGWETLTEPEWANYSNSPLPAFGNSEAKYVFQAPAQSECFVGRLNIIKQLTILLTDFRAERPIQVVTLVGMGGIGKTAIAAEIAHRIRNRFGDGVLWSVGSTGSLMEIVNSWAPALGYQLSGQLNPESASAIVRGALTNKQYLLVIDDAVVASHALKLLPNNPTCKLLLTTQNQEVAAAMGGIAISIPELTIDEGIDILRKILGSRRVDQELGMAHEICGLLEGHPLAIEIAARQLAVRNGYNLANMASMLHDIQHRLGLRISDRALRTSFESSWRDLDDTLRNVFIAAGVFEGRAFTSDAIGYILQVDVQDATNQLHLLSMHSLLASNNDGTYRQHKLLSDYSSEKLSTELLNRFADYYFSYVADHTDKYEIARNERLNVMGGMRAAYRMKRWEFVVSYAEVCGEMWKRVADYTGAKEGYQYAITASQEISDRKRELDFLHCLSVTSLEQHEYIEAEGIAKKVIEAANQYHDVELTAKAHQVMARVCLERSDYPGAKHHLTLCQSLFGQIGNNQGIAQSTYLSGVLAYDCQDYDIAAERAKDSIIMLEKGNDLNLAISPLRLLVDIAIEQSKHDEAETLCLQAIQICESTNDRSELHAIYYGLAVIYRYQERISQALQYSEYSALLAHRVGDLKFEALALYEQSKCILKLEQASVASDQALTSLQIFEDLGDTYNAIFVLSHLGDIAITQKNRDAARNAWTTALEYIEDRPHPCREELLDLIAGLDSQDFS